MSIRIFSPKFKEKRKLEHDQKENSTIGFDQKAEAMPADEGI